MRTIKGLTLIELMVVVAIITIIAAVAYPLYTEQSRKARRAEAKTALQAIALAQERFYTVSGRYTNDYTELFISTLAADAAGLDGPCTGSACATKRAYYTATVSQPSGNQSFTVTATAPAASPQSDDSCKGFSITHLGVKDVSSGDVDKCW